MLSHRGIWDLDLGISWPSLEDQSDPKPSITSPPNIDDFHQLTCSHCLTVTGWKACASNIGLPAFFFAELPACCLHTAHFICEVKLQDLQSRSASQVWIMCDAEPVPTLRWSWRKETSFRCAVHCFSLFLRWNAVSFPLTPAELSQRHKWVSNPLLYIVRSPQMCEHARKHSL